MSVVKINVLQVPAERAEVLEQRFAARAGEVEKVDGFESFDLLRPTGGTDRYLVVTRWRDEASFEAWMSSAAFTQGHAPQAAAAPEPAATPSGEEGHGWAAGQGPAPSGEAGDPDAAPSAHTPDPSHTGPAASGSELWGFEVVISATGRG